MMGRKRSGGSNFVARGMLEGQPLTAVAYLSMRTILQL